MGDDDSKKAARETKPEHYRRVRAILDRGSEIMASTRGSGGVQIPTGGSPSAAGRGALWFESARLDKGEYCQPPLNEGKDVLPSKTDWTPEEESLGECYA